MALVAFDETTVRLPPTERIMSDTLNRLCPTHGSVLLRKTIYGIASSRTVIKDLNIGSFRERRQFVNIGNLIQLISLARFTAMKRLVGPFLAVKAMGVTCQLHDSYFMAPKVSLRYWSYRYDIQFFNVTGNRCLTLVWCWTCGVRLSVPHGAVIDFRARLPKLFGRCASYDVLSTVETTF